MTYEGYGYHINHQNFIAICCWSFSGILVLWAIFGVYDPPDGPDTSIIELHDSMKIPTTRYKIGQ